VRKKPRLRKKVDEVTQVSCTLGRGVIREEVWVDSRNAVARYNLAFINHQIYAGDNGRVLGYDNKHGRHHRHFMGQVDVFAFRYYEGLLTKFLDEVSEIRTWS
jgi:Family of unknown function (DUF6516)